MDFSGHAGRVIENPREALSAALEEAQAWRVRGLRPSLVCWDPSLWVFVEWEGEREEPREGPQLGGARQHSLQYPDSCVPHCSAEEDKPPPQPAYPVLGHEPQCRLVMTEPLGGFSEHA